MSNYLEFRGKCKEFAEQAIASDSTLTLMRGYYHCPLWGKQAHWWCQRADGTIVDPSVKQFPTQGAGAEYEPFDGYHECEYCGKKVAHVQQKLKGGVMLALRIEQIEVTGDGTLVTVS